MEAEEGGSPADLSTLGQDSSSGSLFKFEKKDQTSLLQLKGSAADRKQTGDDTGSFGLEALYGHLFFPTGDQFSGYYFLTGKVESDSRQRFNATFGYFPPKIGGETKLTYRLLHAQVRDTLALSGEFEEGALEQGIGLTYRKRYTLLLKELAFKYAYTHLGGESIESGPFNLDSPTVWRQVRTDTGFGDVDTHDALIEFAVGSDALDNPVLQGIRFDVGGGYQHVNYGEYSDTDEITDEGFTGIAELKACTPFGVLKGWYQDGQAAKTAYGGYQLGGLDVYYKNIDYQYGENEEIIGIAFTLDLFNTSSAFDRRCRPFFYPSDTGYSSVYQMGHIGGLDSDEFSAKPRVNEVVDDIYSVDRTSLPGNVRVDDTGDPKLVVTTSCTQINIISVIPSSAAGAAGLNGNTITINIADLPVSQQSIIIRTNDSCCGDTQVTIMTSSGSLAVNSVNVKEGVGCIPTTVTPDPCAPDLPKGTDCTLDCECASQICGSTTDTCGGDSGDTCTDDGQCKTGLFCDTAYNQCITTVTPDPCAPDLPEGTDCTLDCECASQICGSTTGTCGGDLYQECTTDSQCKAGICGSTSGTCGGDPFADSCTDDSQCKFSCSGGTCWDY